MNAQIKKEEVKKEVLNKNETSIKTWSLVQEVAKSEVSANSRMANIFKNFMQIYQDGNMDISNYFEKTANDKSLKSIFFNVDGTRKTLIAKDFSLFTDKVLILALGQNFDNFQSEFEYEYKALIQVAPVVMFGLANRQYLDLDKMIFETHNPKIPNQIILDWSIFKYDTLKDGAEKTFKENLVKKLFLQTEIGKNYYAFFRGNRGIIEIAKSYFMPKKVHAENVQNAITSPFTKELKSIVDDKDGALGRNLMLTQVAKNEPITSPSNQRQNLEVDACYEVIEKSIKLISSTQSKYAQKMLLEIHQLVLAQLTADNFNEQYPKVKLHKVEFNPKVKNTVIDLLNGADLIKYVSNI